MQRASTQNALGEIVMSPQRYPRESRGFLSFSGHPGDLVTVLYTQDRVPRSKADFTQSLLQNLEIQASGQVCVNMTIPFTTKPNEFGVMYFEARDPNTGNVVHHVSVAYQRSIRYNY
jgi:hypothetical protein